ncbi:MAG: type 1 glutamine amidotransferase domain-containing protein [Myxococcota bacterium]
MKKVALIVTNATGPLPSGPTGLFLPELAHPYFALVEGGYEPVLVSPLGGRAANDLRHIDQVLDDELVARFYEDAELMALIDDTKAPTEVDSSEYAAVVYIGGHGAPFDYRSSKTLNAFAERIYAQGGIVAGICHGVCGLIDLENDAGQPLVAGRRVTGFSNEEEGGLRDAMPYLLEDALVAQGAVFSRVQPWASNVEVDGRLISGQQHRSAAEFTRAVMTALSEGARKGH